MFRLVLYRVHLELLRPKRSQHSFLLLYHLPYQQARLVCLGLSSLSIQLVPALLRQKSRTLTILWLIPLHKSTLMIFIKSVAWILLISRYSTLVSRIHLYALLKWLLCKITRLPPLQHLRQCWCQCLQIMLCLLYQLHTCFAVQSPWLNSLSPEVPILQRSVRVIITVK